MAGILVFGGWTFSTFNRIRTLCAFLLEVVFIKFNTFQCRQRKKTKYLFPEST